MIVYQLILLLDTESPINELYAYFNKINRYRSLDIPYLIVSTPQYLISSLHRVVHAQLTDSKGLLIAQVTNNAKGTPDYV